MMVLGKSAKNISNSLLIGYVGLFSCLLVIVGWIVVGAIWPSGKVSITHTGPTIESISKLRELVTLKVTIGDVLKGSTESIFGSEMIVIVSGEALISVDLSKALISKDESTKTAQIGLVVPRVLMAKVNHDRTEIYSVRSKSPIPVPFSDGRNELYKKCMEEAEKLILRSATNDENIQRAKEQAESIIRYLYSELGWTINFDWSSP